MTTSIAQTYELTLHFIRPPFHQMVHIQQSEDINQYLRDRIDNGLLNHKEYMWMMVLTQANRVLGFRELSSGTTTGTPVPFKEIAQICLLANATSCVLIHNHPSGSLTASTSDRMVTKRVAEVLHLIDVVVLDHLIITQEGYLSFADENLLEPP